MDHGASKRPGRLFAGLEIVMRNICVQSLSDLPDLSKANLCVLDTETSGFYPYHQDRIAGIAVGAYDDDAAYYIPVRHAATSRTVF